MKNQNTYMAAWRKIVSQTTGGFVDRSQPVFGINAAPVNRIAGGEIARVMGVPFAQVREVYDRAAEQYQYFPLVRGKSPTEQAARRIICAVFPSARELFCGLCSRPFREEQAPKSALQRFREMPLAPCEFKYDRAVGIEIECFGKLDRETMRESLPVWTRIESDGSLNCPAGNRTHEIRALLVRREMEPRLHRLCRLVSAMGLKVNKSCGFHVHFDFRGHSLSDVVKVARRADKWLAAMAELVPASRRDNTFCKFGTSQSDRYHAVNLCSFSKHSTLEIRLHSGTVDYSKILAWIRLCELVLAMKTAPKTGQDCLTVLNSLPLAEHDRAYWLARHRALNPHRYAQGETAGAQEQE